MLTLVLTRRLGLLASVVNLLVSDLSTRRKQRNTKTPSPHLLLGPGRHDGVFVIGGTPLELSEKQESCIIFISQAHGRYID